MKNSWLYGYYIFTVDINLYIIPVDFRIRALCSFAVSILSCNYKSVELESIFSKGGSRPHQPLFCPSMFFMNYFILEDKT